MSSKNASAVIHSDDIDDIDNDDNVDIVDDAAPDRESKSLLPALKPASSLVPYEPAGLPVPAGGLGTLDAFLRAAERAPMLSAEEERSLAIDLRDHDDLAAAQKLVLSHLRLVVSIARGYLGYGLPYADLIQEGNIGLMKAIRRYDPDTHNEAERIALTLDVKPKEVLDMEERMYGQEASLDAPSDADSDENYSPSDWLTRKSDEPEAMLEEEDKQRLEGEGLQKALASLDPRSRRVIEARYLNVDAEGNAKPVTLQALAKEFNISAERVRQIEKLAIKKMHGELAGEDPF